MSTPKQERTFNQERNTYLFLDTSWQQNYPADSKCTNPRGPLTVTALAESDDHLYVFVISLKIKL